MVLMVMIVQSTKISPLHKKKKNLSNKLYKEKFGLNFNLSLVLLLESTVSFFTGHFTLLERDHYSQPPSHWVRILSISSRPFAS